MADNILSNPTITVNRDSLLNLQNLLNKSSALAQLMFECRIIDFDKEEPFHQYLWALSDGILIAEAQLDALMQDKTLKENELIEDSHQRLHHMLKIAAKMRRLVEKPNLAKTIGDLKHQLTKTNQA